VCLVIEGHNKVVGTFKYFVAAQIADREVLLAFIELDESRGFSEIGREGEGFIRVNEDCL